MRKSHSFILLLAIAFIAGAFFYPKEEERNEYPTIPSGMVATLVPLRGVLSASVAGEKASEWIDVIVEIPRGSPHKYRFDESKNAAVFEGALPEAVHFPGEYGVIARTRAEDGKALEVVVLTKEPTYPGVLIQARPLGVFVLDVVGGKDYNVLAVPVTDQGFLRVTDLTNLSSDSREEIAEYYRMYRNSEGKRMKVLGWENADFAREIIQKTREDYVERK